MNKLTPPCHPDKIEGLNDITYVRQAIAYVRHHGMDALSELKRKNLTQQVKRTLYNRFPDKNKPKVRTSLNAKTY